MRSFYLSVLLSAFLFIQFPQNIMANSYMGIGISRVDMEIPVTDGGESNGFKIFAGDQSSNLGWELTYQDFDEIAIRPGNAVVAGGSLNFSMLVFMQVNPSFDWFLRVSMSLWELDIGSFSGAYDESGADITYGFGGQFDLSEKMRFRIGYEIYNGMDNKDIDLLNFNLLFSY